MELYRIFNYAGDPLVYVDPLIINVGTNKLLSFVANNGFNQIIEYDDGVKCPLFTLASGKISEWAVPNHPKGRQIVEHKSKCALDITELLKHSKVDLDSYNTVAIWKEVRGLLFKKENGKSQLMVAIPGQSLLVPVGTFKGMSSVQNESKVQEITNPKIELHEKKEEIDFDEVELGKGIEKLNLKNEKAVESDLVLDLESFEVAGGNSNSPITLVTLKDFSYAVDVTSRHFSILPYYTRPIVFKDSKDEYKILGLALEENIVDYEFKPKQYDNKEQIELHILTKYLIKKNQKN